MFTTYKNKVRFPASDKYISVLRSSLILDERVDREIDEHVFSVIQKIPATDARIRKIVEKTEEDAQLQELVGYITGGLPLAIEICKNVAG